MAEALESALILNVKQFVKATAEAEARLQKMAAGIDQTTIRTSKKAEAALTGQAQGWAKLGQVSGAQRFVLQNTSAQIGDIAVQLAAGTSASRVLGQQLPQVFGGFAALGGTLGIIAPLLGTIFAIGAPVVGMWLAMGDNAKTFDDQLKELSESVREYEAAAKAAEIPTEDLQKKYGAASDAARAFLATLREIAAVDSLEKLDATLDSIASRFENTSKFTADQIANQAEQAEALRARLAEVQAQLAAGGLTREREQGLIAESLVIPQALFQIVDLRRNLLFLADDFGLNEEAASSLAAAIVRVGEADGPEAQADAARRLLDALVAALGPYEQMSAEARNLYDETAKAGEEAARLAGLAGSVDFSGAAASAARVADELARAVENAQSLASAGISDVERARINYEFRDDPMGRAAALANADFNARTKVPADADSTVLNVIEQQRRAFVAARVEAERYNQATQEARGTSRGRGRGGNATEAEHNKLLAEKAQLLESLKTPAEKFADQLARIQLLQAKGLVNEEEANRAVENLRKLQPVAQSVADSLRNAFTSAFDDAAGALESLGKQLAMIALQMQLAKVFPTVFGSGGIIPLGRASGGIVHGPGTGTSDSIPARLSNGEYVINARATAKHREILDAINSGRALKMASGGYVGIPSIPRASGGGGAPVITINNQGPPVEVTRTEQQRGPDGREMFTLWLNQDLVRGRAAQGLKANGVKKPPIVR